MALVLYHSQEHGNTELMAKTVEEGARGAGAPNDYSYIASTLKTFVDDWYIATQKCSKGLKGKPYGLFYSHGVRGTREAQRLASPSSRAASPSPSVLRA